jgi:Ca-activated chloride channel family protein
MTFTRAPHVALIPARPALAAGRESTLDLLIRIEAPAADTAPARRLLNLGIVLDRSGSMAGAKLRHAREAVAFAANNMAAEDRVSLTIYDDKVVTLVSSDIVAAARPRILELLEGVHPGGSTALHDAWVQGGLQVSAHLDASRLNRVLLISDGLANVGETSPELLVSRARELFARGVSTSTIGVGGDFNEDLMIPMAVSGGGSGWFVETPADFRRIFEAELAGLAALYGERGLMRLEPRRKGVEVLEVLNDFAREGREGRDGDGWSIGSLSCGRPMEIVARVRARGGEVGQPLDLLDVRLSWDVPGQGRLEMQQLLRVACDEAAIVDALPPDPQVERVVGLLMAARTRVEAIGLMDAGDIAGARMKLAMAAGEARARFAEAGDPDALADADDLLNLGKLLAEHGPQETAFARKRASYQAYDRRMSSRRNK